MNKIETRNKFAINLICIFILLLVRSTPLNAQDTQDWEIIQEGSIHPIGVDNDDSLNLFYLQANKDTTQTNIIKYSQTGDIIFNRTLNLYYDFFYSAQKYIDNRGDLYLISKTLDEIDILKYDKNMDFIKNVTITSEIISNNFASSRLFITQLGSIYLLCPKSYTLLNETHADREDGLYKVTETGKVEWSLLFGSQIDINSDPLANIAEYYDDLLYFSYENTLYSINSVNGKIKWLIDLNTEIIGLLVFGEDFFTVQKTSNEKSSISLSYFCNKKKVWEEIISPSKGILRLMKVELIRDKIGLKILDSIDGEITGEVKEIFRIYNTNGDELIKRSWDHSVYFLHIRHFFLTYNDSFYTRYYNHTTGNTHITKTSYIAPQYIPPDKSVIQLFMPTIIIFCILLLKRAKDRELYKKNPAY
ncbi:MAG: hypothetical protein KGD64_09185 [Candidatus Heimdallarchaeota archaeon]|nr:hypothetical protein [Candidatus Heimdallarchaeota archaeon]